ncbi:MAG: hypothetical protein P4L99_13755 [Chthoniobacter sp.]|nr:hypothetical protein [Chthoniobacter sp.]
MKTEPSKTPTVLLLTTDPRVVCAVREVAVKWGYDLRVLQDPIAAFYQIRGKPEEINLAVVDLDPGMQAVALLSVSLDRVPVVALTSAWGDRVAEVFRHRGVLNCVMKPFRADQLAAAMEHALMPAAVAV